MKLTKYPQSCIIVETKGKKILVDPGNLKYEETFFERWNQADVLLVTHKHGDHCHSEIIQQLKVGKMYSSQEVASAYPELNFNVTKEGEVIKIGKIKIEVVKAVHGYMPFLRGGKEINENIGFIIDNGEKKVYVTSDSICFENNYKCDILFVPVCNHGLVMGPFEAALFAKETGAQLVIPVHYDNPKYLADLEEVKQEFKKQRLNYKILQNGESVEI